MAREIPIRPAQKLVPHPEETDRDKEGLAAAENTPHGLAHDENPETLRQSDSVDQKPSTPSPDMIKLGAGASLAEHSKDAKAPKGGRAKPAYKKSP